MPWDSIDKMTDESDPWILENRSFVVGEQVYTGEFWGEVLALDKPTKEVKVRLASGQVFWYPQEGLSYG